MSKAVVVMDMSNDTLTDGKGYAISLAKPQARRIIDSVETQVSAAREAGVPVVYVRDFHKPGDLEFETYGPHCEAGSYGAEIVEELAPRPGEPVLPKEDILSFTNPEVDTALQELGVKTVYLNGVWTEYCVKGFAMDGEDKFGQAVKGALSRGYEVYLVLDGTFGLDEIVGADGAPIPGTRGSVTRALTEMFEAGVKPIYSEQVIDDLVRG